MENNRRMFDVVVVGTDGSESADVALRQATALTALSAGTLHIVSVYRLVSHAAAGVAATAGAAVDVGQLNEGSAEEAERVCEQAGAQARGQGVKVVVHVVAGDPADALVRVAQEVNADLLIVGNRGMSGKRRFVLGSVPNKVSHHSPCSLLIVDTTTH
jgi:nucleotide-binding universal stress UspA family protein